MKHIPDNLPEPLTWKEIWTILNAKGIRLVNNNSAVEDLRRKPVNLN
jgi:hypothetical protein